MTLPAKCEKGYLEVSESGAGFWIVGKKDHTSELGSLYAQHGIRCHQEPSAEPDEELLRFDGSVEKAQLQELLDSYKNVKGS